MIFLTFTKIKYINEIFSNLDNRFLFFAHAINSPQKFYYSSNALKLIDFLIPKHNRSAPSTIPLSKHIFDVCQLQDQHIRLLYMHADIRVDSAAYPRCTKLYTSAPRI